MLQPVHLCMHVSSIHTHVTIHRRTCTGLYHTGEQQGSFSVERDWIQKSVVNYFETTMNLQDATVTRYCNCL